MGSSFLLIFPGLNRFKFAKVFLNLLLLINKSASAKRNSNLQNTQHCSAGPDSYSPGLVCPPNAKNIATLCGSPSYGLHHRNNRYYFYGLHRLKCSTSFKMYFTPPITQLLYNTIFLRAMGRGVTIMYFF